MTTGYERDGAAIYRESFAMIRREADLSGVPPALERVAVRMMHACGMTDLVDDLAWSAGFAERAQAALAGGAPVLCDSSMVAAGITRSRLPAGNDVLCMLRDQRTAGLAARLDFTLDEIEDLRIAVDEACGILLSQAAPGASLSCDFTLAEDSMTIAVSVRSQRAQPPSRDTFAWTVLSALAGTVDAWVGPGGKVTVLLRKSREPSRSL